MEESVSGFLKSLREEVIHHKDKRATFVLQKLVSVAALFGLGSGKLGSINLPMLLFTVPFVSLALDVYISAEDYKVKRIGTFFRIYRYATPAERNWERFVNQHREPVAVWASLVLTAIAALASAFVLHTQNSEAINTTGTPLWPEGAYWVWAFVAAAFTVGVFVYYWKLMEKLPKPHLLERQVCELVSAPGEDSLAHLRDKLIIILTLNTGITKKELVALEVDDLHQLQNGALALRIRDSTGCSERLVHYRRPQEVLDIVKKWKELAGIAEGLVFPDLASRKPRQMKASQIDKILRKYPIVVDGAIQTVKADELRRTYARYLYEDGADLMTIQRNLGCTDIKAVLGYIGPIAVQRELRQTSFIDQS